MKKSYYLISHNEFASGLHKAIEMIIGKQKNLKSFGLMPGEHPDEIIEIIDKEITDDMEVVILGDIAGGSVCNSALALTTYSNVVLVTGTNLPVALEIILAQVTDLESINEIIIRVREEIKTLRVEPVASDSGEDFF